MNMKTNVYKILIMAYSVILVWGFVKQVVSFYYHDLGYADMVWSLVPDDLECPQYDIYTNEITNGVAEWEYTDYIPERLYKVHKWFDRNYKDWGMDGYLIMNMILFFPMLICYYKNKTKPYFPIVMFVTAILFAKFVMKWNILALIFIK